MQVISEDLIKNKRVLLHLDFDVPLTQTPVSHSLISEAGQNLEFKTTVADDRRLAAGLQTLEFCLEHGDSVIVMGHLGRPGGKFDPNLSVGPVVEWLQEHFKTLALPEGKLHVLENLRFEPGESFDSAQDREKAMEFAKELAALGDVYINEAFAAYHAAASNTLVPTLLPHAAGFRFALEVKTLLEARENPQKPLVVIIGGAKVEDKYQAVVNLSQFADAVLVGGLLPQKIKDQNLEVKSNVMLGKLNEEGTDLAPETVDSFISVIKNAKQVIWGGPVGKYEDIFSNLGNERLAQAIVDSNIYSIIGGGDTQAAIKKYLDKFNFVSTGGGAMLELLAQGSIPSLDALNA